MPAPPVFQAIITALDHASPALHAIAKSLGVVAHEAEDAGKKSEKAGHEIERASHAGGRGFAALTGHVNVARGAFGHLTATIGETRHGLVEFLPMLGALGTGMSIFGIFELVHGVAETRLEMERTREKLGMTAAALGGFVGAAKLTHTPVEAVTAGFEKLNVAIGKAAGGGNKNVAALFAHLHIPLRDAHGQITTLEAALPRLTNAFEATHNDALRGRMAVALFGRGGQELVPMLKLGAAEIKHLSDEMRAVAYRAGPHATEDLHHFEHGWILLEAAVKGFKTQIGVELAPVLTPVLDVVKDWVVTNRAWMATFVVEKVKAIAEALKAMLPYVRPNVEAFAAWAGRTAELIDRMGGFKVVVIATAAVMAGPLISAVLDVGRAVAAFGIMLATTPVGWFLIAVGLIAGASYALWANWDWVKARFQALYAWWERQDGWVKAVLTSLVPFIAVPLAIIEHWTPIKQFFLDLWDGVTASFRAGWASIEPIVDAVTRSARLLAHPFSGDGGLHDPGASGEPGVGGPSAFTIPGLPPAGPYTPGAAPAPAGGRADGRVDVTIRIPDAPPGTRVEAQGSGIAAAPTTELGVSSMGSPF